MGLIQTTGEVIVQGIIDGPLDSRENLNLRRIERPKCLGSNVTGQQNFSTVAMHGFGGLNTCALGGLPICVLGTV